MATQTQIARAEMLWMACRQLAARDTDRALEQNGIGFNGTDSYFGHRLAEHPWQQWTPKQERAAWVMLRKYRVQLSGYGIEYGTIPEPTEAEVAAHEARKAEAKNKAIAAQSRVFVHGQRYVIMFAYNAAMVDAVKRIDGRKFDAEQVTGSREKGWTVPINEVTTLKVLSFAVQFGCQVAPDLQEKADAIRADAKAAAAELARLEEEERKAEEERLAIAKELEATSRSAESDFHVEGLGGTLRPFQRAGVAYAIKAGKTFIADEMGLGKTVQALAVLHHKQAYPAVVVCPAALKMNWRKEAAKWLPNARVQVLSGTKAPGEYQTKALRETTDIYIINYDVLKDWADFFINIGVRAAVADESHRLKNTKALRTKAFNKISDTLAENDTVLLLTGTPVLNKPSELVSQLKILNRLKYFGGWAKFVKQYCGAFKDRFGWNTNGAANLLELNQKLRGLCYIRREKKDVLTDLPAKQRATVPLEIDNWEEYNEAEADVVKYVGRKATEDKEFLASLQDLDDEQRAMAKEARRNNAEYKAAQAEILVRIGKCKQVAARGKLAAGKEWVEDFIESGEKLVVFAYHKEIQAELVRNFPGCAHLMNVDGTTMDATAKEVQKERFMTDPECKIIVCSLAADREGHTLTAASNVAFFELGWTPGEHDQAEDRCHRIGQTDSVTAWYLMGRATIDEEIGELIDKKRAVVTATTDGRASEQSGSIMADLAKRLMAKAAQ